jgi:hypothetical protein
MKSLRNLIICAGAAVLLSGLPAMAKTCCEKAGEEGKECKNKCCINAHREKRSCLKCNPNKEDLKLIEAKPTQKAAKGK